MSSDPFPCVGEDDLWSFPEPNLCLAIKNGTLKVFLIIYSIY